jgi:hypothetical protein
VEGVEGSRIVGTILAATSGRALDGDGKQGPLLPMTVSRVPGRVPPGTTATYRDRARPR